MERTFYSGLVLSLLAVVRSGKHARRSVWTFRHLDCYLDTPHPPHSDMPAFHSEFSAIWGELFYRNAFCGLSIGSSLVVTDFLFSTSVKFHLFFPFRVQLEVFSCSPFGSSVLLAPPSYVLSVKQDWSSGATGIDLYKYKNKYIAFYTLCQQGFRGFQTPLTQMIHTTHH